jgi:cytidine deaminase
VAEISNWTLIEKAKAVVNPKRIGDYLVGDVGCALVTDKGNIYLGVCIDAMSGMGFCAEHSAIAAMVTAGEYRIARIVAVWNDQEGSTHILSPCGRCREFIRQMHPDNLTTEVIMDTDKVLTLAELLPYANWFHKIEER